MSETSDVSRLFGAIRRLLIGLIFVYGAGMAILAIVVTLRLYQSWWLTLANMFALVLFIPLLVCIPAALLIGSAWLRSAVALAIVAFLALFGGQLLPPSTPTPAGAPLRVMTFNLLYKNQRSDAIIGAIRAHSADVVALQELSSPVAAAIDRDLRAAYPYQYLRPSDNSRGLGIISRYPFQSRVEFPHNIRGLQVTFQVDRQTVTLINLHLRAPDYNVRKLGGLPIVTGYDTRLPSRQVRQLAEMIDSIHGPLIVMGDFNTSDRELRYDTLESRMHDAFRETNWGFGYSYPNHNRIGPITLPFPLIRIDYVWSRSGVLPAATQTECSNVGTDHCLLVADLRVDTLEGGERHAWR